MRRMVTRIGAVTSATFLSVALFAPTTAVAELEGEFAAQADGSQLFVDAVNFNALTAEPPVNSIATIGVAPTQAQVANPDGLGGGVISRGFGQNLDLSVLDTQVPLDLSTAEQTAPPDNAEPTVTTLADLSQAAPLLTGAVSQSTAWARDPAAIECPDEGRAVISEGTSTTTDLGVLEIEEGTTLVSVRDPQDGTLTSTSGTYVGSEGQIIAESTAQTAAANIAGELVVEAVNPTLTATATGNPGGASVEYTGEVRVNGEKIAGVQENTLSLDALVDVLTPLDEQALNQLTGPLDEATSEVLTPLTEQLPIFDEQGYTGQTLTELIENEVIQLDELAFLNPTVRVTAGQLENVTESADGTRAAGEVKTVRVELNVVSTLTETEVPILTFHLMPLAVDAQAPAGGLDCGAATPAGDAVPFQNLRKEASTAVVAPGDSFDYTITVPNDDPTCTVTDVSVTDVVSGPSGFEITGASDGGTIDGDTVSWDLDDLAPGDEHTVTLTVEVPNTAQDGDTFDDEVTATGTCDGQPVSGDFLLPDIPTVATGDVGVNLPRTGGGMALLGLGALAAAGRLRRRR